MPEVTISQWVVDNLCAPAVAGVASLWTTISGMQSSRISKLEKKVEEMPSAKEFEAHLGDDRRSFEVLTKGQEAVWGELTKLRETMTQGFNALQVSYFEGERRRLELENERIVGGGRRRGDTPK